MTEEEEKRMAAGVAAQHLPHIDELLAAENLDSDACLDGITAMWVAYLALRTTGAEGEKGKKGRGKPPQLRVSSLAAQLTRTSGADDGVAEDMVLKRMRKMQARAGD